MDESDAAIRHNFIFMQVAQNLVPTCASAWSSYREAVKLILGNLSRVLNLRRLRFRAELAILRTQLNVGAVHWARDFAFALLMSRGM